MYFLQGRQTSPQRQSRDPSIQPSSAPSGPQNSCAGSGDFSEAQLLMNGQADSMRQSDPGAGSHLVSSDRETNGLRATSSGEVGTGDQELLGQQTLDFWLNLCICHTLIVEEAKDGGQSVFQVHHQKHPPLTSGTLQVEPRRDCVRICTSFVYLGSPCVTEQTDLTWLWLAGTFT